MYMKAIAAYFTLLLCLFHSWEKKASKKQRSHLIAADILLVQFSSENPKAEWTWRPSCHCKPVIGCFSRLERNAFTFI